MAEVSYSLIEAKACVFLITEGLWCPDDESEALIEALDFADFLLGLSLDEQIAVSGVMGWRAPH